MANSLVVQGKFQRLIRLNTPLEVAFTYFTDFGYVLPRLPEIERVMRFKDGRYRMLFMADDGRGHEMGIVFDIRHEVKENSHIKMVALPVSRQDLSGDGLSKGPGPLFPGLFSGEVIFTENGDQIEVAYIVNLVVEIEVPRFLSFMPRPVLHKLGDSLMQLKLHSIGNGFADNLLADFSTWFNRHQQDLAVASPVTAVSVMAAPLSNLS